MSSKIVLYDAVGSPIDFDADALKGGLATAWAVTSTDDTISHSYNIASITKISDGVFDVVFATPMDNIGYAVSATLTEIIGGAAYSMNLDSVVPKTINGFRMAIIAVSTTFVIGAGTLSGFSLTVHGGKA